MEIDLDGIAVACGSLDQPLELGTVMELTRGRDYERLLVRLVVQWFDSDFDASLRIEHHGGNDRC